MVRVLGLSVVGFSGLTVTLKTGSHLVKIFLQGQLWPRAQS